VDLQLGNGLGVPEFKGNVVSVQTVLYWDTPPGAIELKHDRDIFEV